MSSRPRFRLIGPWGNVEIGKRYVRPFNAGALDQFGLILEAATGDMATAAVDLCALDIQALGAALRRVAAGEDARHVFGQNKVGHKQNERLRIQWIAILYLRTLADHLAAGNVSDLQAKRLAVARAREFAPGKLDAETLSKYARTHRDVALRHLENMHRAGQGPDVTPLRAYFARHSRKGRTPD